MNPFSWVRKPKPSHASPPMESNIHQMNTVYSLDKPVLKQRTDTDCDTTRFSLGSVASSFSSTHDTTIGSGAESLERSKHDTHRYPRNTSHVSSTSLMNMMIMSKRPCLQGRLSSSLIKIYLSQSFSWSKCPQIQIQISGTYQGKSTWTDGTSWRHRHSELAQTMTKEVLYQLLCIVHMKTHQNPPTTDMCEWRRLLRCQTLCDELDEESITNDENTPNSLNIQANVTHIEWGRGFRWGGDALYDPNVDGNIHVQGSCIFDDQRPQPPIWQLSKHNTSDSYESLITPNDILTHINSNSQTVAFGHVEDCHHEKTESPWHIATLSCSYIQVKL